MSPVDRYGASRFRAPATTALDSRWGRAGEENVAARRDLNDPFGGDQQRSTGKDLGGFEAADVGLAGDEPLPLLEPDDERELPRLEVMR